MPLIEPTLENTDELPEGNLRLLGFHINSLKDFFPSRIIYFLFEQFCQPFRRSQMYSTCWVMQTQENIIYMDRIRKSTSKFKYFVKEMPKNYRSRFEIPNSKLFSNPVHLGKPNSVILKNAIKTG